MRSGADQTGGARRRGRLDSGVSLGRIAATHGLGLFDRGGGAIKRGRPVYCRDSADWDQIRVRAESVDKSVSYFVMTCALHDATPTPTSPLVLTPEEQRDLLRNVQDLNQRLVGMFFGKADGGPPLIEAAQLLYQLHNGEFPFDMGDRTWRRLRKERCTFPAPTGLGGSEASGRWRGHEDLALPRGASAECRLVYFRRPPAAAGAEC